MRENYVYPACIKKISKVYEITFPDFPELISCEIDEEKTIETAQELLAITILDYLQNQRELPKPSVNVSDVVYVHIWLPYFRNKAKEIYIKKTLTIPQWLDILAREKNINFSAALVKGIKKELGLEE